MTKASAGRYFEDFAVGQRLEHATPRTLTEGDAAVYAGLYGGRYALYSSAPFARSVGLAGAPLDPLLVFHMVFGKTVPDVSLNAIANLGYAEGRFLAPVFPGQTLRATSEVIGLRETSNRQSGVVWVRTTGFDEADRPVLSYVRWVLVRKRDPHAPAPDPVTPELAEAVAPDDLALPAGLDFSAYDFRRAGSSAAFEDYAVGERIDHLDGMTVEEAEAQMATRLYQNTARVHFNPLARDDGRRLVYGGVVMSTARALAFNGLENAGLMLALNGGRHVSPYFAGRPLFAWTEVKAKADLGAAGALRLRTIATIDYACDDFPAPDEGGAYPPDVALDLDYWAAIPKRGGR